MQARYTQSQRTDATIWPITALVTTGPAHYKRPFPAPFGTLGSGRRMCNTVLIELAVIVRSRVKTIWRRCEDCNVDEYRFILFLVIIHASIQTLIFYHKVVFSRPFVTLEPDLASKLTFAKSYMRRPPF